MDDDKILGDGPDPLLFPELAEILCDEDLIIDESFAGDELGSLHEPGFMWGYANLEMYLARQRRETSRERWDQFRKLSLQLIDVFDDVLVNPGPTDDERERQAGNLERDLQELIDQYKSGSTGRV